MKETDPSIVQYLTDFKPAVEFFSYLKGANRYFPTLYTEPYFKWKIEDNPFGKSACYLRRQNGTSAAHGSITAKPINPWLGIGAGAAETGDTHTHPHFQKQGHFSALINHYVQEFCSSEPDGPKLIYGFPNDRSLPPYLHRCGFEISNPWSLTEFERSLWKTPSTILKAGLHRMVKNRPQSSCRFYLCNDGAKTAEGWDSLWEEAGSKETYLLKKDGTWWHWRYHQASESYRTYVFKEKELGRSLAYIVVKVNWGRRLRFVQICDVFGDTSDWAVIAFRHFVRLTALPFDTLRLWTHAGSKLADAAMDEGFVKKRDVPVIFFKNQAYDHLRRHANVVQIALGDSDNV